MVVIQTASNYTARIDWATPEVAGKWFAGLVESGLFETYDGGQYRQMLEVYPLRPNA